MKISVHTQRLITRALEEDIGKGDVTTKAIKVTGIAGRAVLLGNSAGILFGGKVFERVFQQLDSSIRVQWDVKEGKPYKAGARLAVLEGDQAALLTGERTALNFLAHLCGIATLTSQFVAAIEGTDAKVLDTRKTTPGWRELEKQAVKAGGGTNHRMNLYDAVMIKNNHITACGDIDLTLEKVRYSRRRAPRDIPIICEVRTIQQFRKAVAAGIRWILLDHFTTAQLRKVVAEIRGRERKRDHRIILEASGGVTLKNIRARAKTGVDYISVGALTQSAPAADLSLRLV
jgi:nicotinate-nucleotide pyrophosphorylase (carboxylating)